MSLDKPKRIEDFILNHLQTGPLLMLDLVNLLKSDRPNTTKQAVYAALRELKKSEQILTYKGMASINLTWLNYMVIYFNLAKRNYVKGSEQGSFIDLEDKEKIKYYFKNPIKADVFWTHVLYLLGETSTSNKPFYFYNPHEWFLLIRNENELKYFNSIAQKGHPALVTVGSANFLDRYVRKYFDNDSKQYNIKEKPLFKDNNYYLNIIDDFLIEVWLDKKMADQLDVFYKETDKWDEAANIKLQMIINTESKMRIVISRNHKKAERIINSLKRDFVIK